MTDWLQEVVVELQNREELYRQKPNEEDEYWNHVANGISEALDVLEEADGKRAAQSLENNE